MSFFVNLNLLNAKYTVSMQNVVSEDAIITDANLPINESGPKSLKIDDTNAKDPLPEIGFISINGTISFGIFKKLANEVKSLTKTSIAPDSLNMLTETIKAKIAGASLNVDFIPSFAPSTNASKTGVLLIIAKIMINKIIKIVKKAPKVDIDKTYI